MAIKIDHSEAARVLNSAFTTRKLLQDSTAENITDVLTGSHKTYRYILITALLAKATDDKIDVYSIQAQDNSTGAYDARSLCHKVIVKFERNVLPNGLGGSNEPFLNKPARFPRISADNAVRKGNDTIALGKIIKALGQIQDKNQAFSLLCHAVAVMEINHEGYEKKYQISDVNSEVEDSIQAILDFICSLCEKSCEGEICPLVVSSLEHIFLGKEFRVVPHKVNESGSSSKEIGDIDIYNSEEKIVFSFEVKDKTFSQQDVEHAVKKFVEAKIFRSFFIYGKNVEFSERTSILQMLGRFGRMGYYCCFVNIIDYSKLRLASIPDIKLSSFVSILLYFAKVINASDETIEWIKETYKRSRL